MFLSQSKHLIGNINELLYDRKFDTAFTGGPQKALMRRYALNKLTKDDNQFLATVEKLTQQTWTDIPWHKNILPRLWNNFATKKLLTPIPPTFKWFRQAQEIIKKHLDIQFRYMYNRVNVPGQDGLIFSISELWDDSTITLMLSNVSRMMDELTVLVSTLGKGFIIP